MRAIGKALGFPAASYGRPASTDADYLDSTITIGERTTWTWAGRRDQRELIELCAGYTLMSAMLVARYCANQPCRLYRRARKTKPGPEGRRLKAWMRTLGGKAAQSADRSDDIQEVDDHPILEVLRRPNIDESGTDYHRFLYLCRMIPGNGYEYVIDPNGSDRAMRCLFPGYVTVLPGPDRLVGAYRYGRDPSAVRVFEPSEVVHHKHMPSLTDPLYGVSPMACVVTENKTLQAAVYREMMSILNDRRPDFAVVMQPGTAQAQIDRAREFFKREHQGPSKVRLPLIAEGVDIKTFGWSNRDMEAPALLESFRKAVKDAYGVGDMLDSKSAGQISIGSGGVGDAEKRFIRQVVLPEVTAVCELRTDFMLPMFGLDPNDYWFAPDNPIVDDVVQVRTSQVALMNAAAMTINEQRAAEGLEPVEGGDVPRYNGVPLDRVGAMPMFPPAGPGDGPEPADEPEEDDAEEADTAPEAKHALAVKDKRPDRPAGPAYTIDRRPFEVSRAELETALRSWFRRDLAPAVVGSVRDTGELVIDFDKQTGLVEAFNKATLPSLTDLFRVGYNRGVAETAANGGTLKPMAEEGTEASRYLRDYQGKLIRSVTDSVSDSVRQTLADGMAANESRDELVSRVQEALGPQASQYRAAMIADTESGRAYEAARNQAWNQSGIVIGRRWLLSGNPCPTCQAIADQYGTAENGQPFAPMGASIDVGGSSVVVGYAPLEPPAHPNCRCSQAPIYRSKP